MNSYKILVIEDEKNICNFMKMIFETNDYQVIFAQNGKNGLTMFFSHNPDLVILDLGLPDMDELILFGRSGQKMIHRSLFCQPERMSRIR